jgi:phosphatidylserine/phosphatidylglycerophosphate/cardiolipin synthase-like enzyme
VSSTLRVLALFAFTSAQIMSSGTFSSAHADEQRDLQLVASWPSGVDGGPDLPATAPVWIEMIEGATSHIDLAHFYASNEPGSRLEDVIVALESAAARGVRVRMLSEVAFYSTYPQTLDRLDAVDGIEVRHLRTREILGGVLHTKSMIVDEREVFVGSPNFDWRALEHIAELGVRVHDRSVALAFADLFENDWRLAAPTSASEDARPARVRAHEFPVELPHADATVRLTPIFGCVTALPEPDLWDWPHLSELVESAERTLELQALSYSPVDFDGSHWPELDNALRSAALRGVQVRLLVSHWDTRPGRIEHLQSLQCIPGIEVRIATVPAHPGGFIPYARVIHSKLVVADGARSWVGTSNFQRTYFYEGRHAGVLVEGASFAGAVLDVFARVWDAPWTEVVDPARRYDPPRVGE